MYIVAWIWCIVTIFNTGSKTDEPTALMIHATVGQVGCIVIHTGIAFLYRFGFQDKIFPSMIIVGKAVSSWLAVGMALVMSKIEGCTPSIFETSTDSTFDSRSTAQPWRGLG